MEGTRGSRNTERKLVSWLLVFAFVITTLFANDITIQAAGKATITINQKEATLIKGKSISLSVKSVTGLKNKAVTWKSSNAKVAKVNTKGKVTAVKEGTAKITATSKSNKKVKATCKITVKKEAVQTINLNKTGIILVKGKTAKVKVKSVVPDGASTDVTWSIGKPSIASLTVKEKTATVKGVKAGKTTLTVKATDGSKKTAVVSIVVVDKKSDVKKVTSVDVSLEKKELFIGETTKAKAVVKPSNATMKTVAWSSSNEKIAKVDANGKITALKAGTVKITATAQDESKKKDSVTLLVKEKVQPTSTPTAVPTSTPTTVPTSTPTAVPTNEPSEIIEIRTEEELRAVANNLKGKYIVMNDIILSMGDWESLGDFEGEFDGNGYKITQLTSTEGKGLFTNLLESAVVKNLTVEGNITTEEQPAALLALSSRGTVINCVSQGSVKQITAASRQALAGMLLDNLGYMERCKNEAEVVGVPEEEQWNAYTYYTGGLVALNTGSMIECSNSGQVTSKCMYTGGVAGGNNSDSIIENCNNTGKIIGTLDVAGISLAVGGITGDNMGLVSGCVNEGDISTTAQTYQYDLGGIVGQSSGYSEITDCENKGNVSGYGKIGGICGELCLVVGIFDENDNFVANSGNIVLSNCRNSGTIVGSGTEERSEIWVTVAGIVASARSMNGKITIDNCFNKGKVMGTGTAVSCQCGGVVGNGYLLDQGSIELKESRNEGQVIANGGESETSNFAGGVFFQLQGDSEIMTKVSNCVNIGEVWADVSYGVGSITGFTQMVNCYNSGNIKGSSQAYGITSNVRDRSELCYCYNIGTLEGSVVYGIACSVGKNAYLTQVYNAGTIIGESDEYKYGAVGYMETNETISPDTPQTRDNFSSCYYLEQDFITPNQYGTPLDNEAIIQQDSYVGFDFDTVWGMKEQNGIYLPYLKVFD